MRESKTKNQNPEFAPFLSPKSQNWCVQSRTAFAAPSFRVHVVSAWLIIGLGTHWKVITACGKATFLMTGQMEKTRVQYLQPLKAYGEWGYHYIFLPGRLQRFEQNEGWSGWREYTNYLEGSHVHRICRVSTKWLLMSQNSLKQRSKESYKQKNLVNIDYPPE